MEVTSVRELSLFKQVDHNWDKLIAAIDAELERLGWTTAQAKEYVLTTYHKRSRQLLSDRQLMEFWQNLKKF